MASTKTVGEETENQKTEEERDLNSDFECNICLDVAQDAVVSMCGHLFCWPCLHRWLETRPNCPMCPVCKAGIGKDKVIPIYGKNNPTDPREKLPPRPQAQRSEPETNFNPFSNFTNLGGFGTQPHNGGWQFTFGIGAFPFTLFSGAFSTGNTNAGEAGTAQEQEEQFLSKAFLWMALLLLIWLFLA